MRGIPSLKCHLDMVRRKQHKVMCYSVRSERERAREDTRTSWGDVAYSTIGMPMAHTMMATAMGAHTTFIKPCLIDWIRGSEEGSWGVGAAPADIRDLTCTLANLILHSTGYAACLQRLVVLNNGHPPYVWAGESSIYHNAME